MSAQNLQALLCSRRVLVIGAHGSPLERGLLAQLTGNGDAPPQAHSIEELRGLLDAQAADGALALVLAPQLLDPALIDRLAASGCTGLVWTGAAAIAEPLLRAARPHRLRFLGSRSAGYFHAEGLHCGAFAAAGLRGGTLALIAQSGSIAAAAVDWAAGRGIGFSWAVTTGGEDDADLADFLDVAALDSATRAVILQLGYVRAGRKFMSAARACARLKPVVVLQSRLDTRGVPAADPVRSAAFARAGLVECETLDGLFDALSALARIPVCPGTRVLTVGNGAGICALGVDAVLRHGLSPVASSVEHFAEVQRRAPRARRLDGAVDLGPVEPEAMAPICAGLLADPGLDYLMLVHSPSIDAPHLAFAEALSAARPEPRLVTVWLGLDTALAARQRCNEAGLATFGTAGQAARALHFRWLHGRTRELLMQTPPPRPHAAIDRAAVKALIDTALQRGEPQLDAGTAAALLPYYGLPAPAAAPDPSQLRFELELRMHAELGMHLAVTAVCGPLRSATAYGFAPLDALLAQRMVESMAMPAADDDADAIEVALAEALLALSDLALELPAVAGLSLRLGVAADGALRSSDARITIDAQPPPERQRLILAPYPDALTRTLETRGGRLYRLRAVRPEDEPALIRLLERLRPEDVRLRFFASIRRFSHELAARMTQIDYDRELTLVAEALDESGRLCAAAQLIIDAYGEGGEFAVLVHHEHAGAGLGHLLMDELLAHGRRHQLHYIYGDVLRENGPMLALARRLGFACRMHPQDPGCRRVEIDLRAAANENVAGQHPA